MAQLNYCTESNPNHPVHCPSDLAVQYRPISSLKLSPYNPRLHRVRI